MKRKIFISINIPEKIKFRLIEAIKKWSDLPFKWTPEINIHLTLVFLGFVPEDDLPEICDKVAKASEKNNIFDIELEKIELFPSAEKPQMLALTGNTNEKLKNLVNDIEKELGISRAPKSFRPHVTLGRIRKYKWQELKNKPPISEKFPLYIAVDSVDIMASDFGEGSHKYGVIEVCPLK